MKYKGLLSALIMLVGGGDLSINATELRTLCTNTGSDCTISTPQSKITNSAPFSSTKQISIQTQITDFINYSTINAQKIEVKNKNKETENNFIANFYNYGRIETTDTEGSLLTDTISTRGFHSIYNYGHISNYVFFAQSEKQNTHIVNYGTMGGIAQNVQHTKPITIANYGEINLFQLNGSGKKYHFSNVNITLQNYAMKINVDSATFNGFSGSASDNSHLILGSETSVRFADKNAKIILDFGDSFEFGAGYLFSKLVVDTSGNNALSVDLSHLTTKSDIYHITQQGEHFVVNIAPQHSAIGNLYKSNVRTMNNFYIMSNAMIYPRKHNLVILREQSDRRISNIADSALDSANNLKSYESFAYRNEAQNRRIQRQNRRNYSRTKRNNNPVILSESEESQKKNNRDSSPTAQNDNGRYSQNLAQNPHDYYFILTPFFNYNSFAESGNYNLSGFDYGFLTAFSAKVAESNSLGTHFMMSYGSLNDSKDKEFSIKTLNLNFGLNYKLDLIWDMYLKARGDFYYFLNQAKTLTMIEAIKPNNLGFGASVAFGKDFDFKNGGVLGIEAGLDYKALQSSTISLHDNIYQKALYHLLYADLGVNYAKYFGNFGVNAGLGIKGNITANKLAKSQIHISNLNRNVDMVLDNDMFLGYANLGASYVLNARDFDMEFSLAYYGNFGDRVISNGGGFEWRVGW